MQSLPRREVLDQSGGMISYAAPDLVDDNVSVQTINMHFDLLGDVQQRNGTTVLGAAVSPSNACQGVGQFITSNQNTNRLVAAFNGNNFAYDGATWTNIGGGMSTTPGVRYASFLNLLFRVGGATTTATWNGSGNFGATNTANSPNGKYLMPYKQRMYIAGDANFPNRLWFSTIASFNGAITWDTSGSSTQYIDFAAAQANDVITALGKISNLLIVWLDNAMYRFNGTSTDAEIVVDIGTPSQESVAQAKGALYFFNPIGIFVTDGRYPIEISRPIYDWIFNISPSNYSKVAGLGDADHYYCFVGDVTKDGRTYSNVMLVYTISSKNWTVYSFANTFRAFTRYKDSTGAISYVGGDTVGNVQTMFSGNTDNGTNINWEYNTKDFYLGSPMETKSVVDMGWLVLNGAGAQVLVREDGATFRTIGEIQDMVTIFKSMNVRGKVLRFKIEGSNNATPVIFSGFEFLNSQTHGYLVA